MYLKICIYFTFFIGSSYSNNVQDLSSLAKVFAMLAGGDNCEFVCPGNAKPKKNHKHVPSSNGCGSFGIEIDVSHYLGFEECCDMHDKCYDTCNKDREKCDDNFKECLRDTCHHNAILKKHDSKQLAKCEQVSDIMHSGTIGLGCAPYKEAQRNACLCNGKKLSSKEAEKLSSASQREL